MTDKAETILKKCVFEDPTVCNRCFAASSLKQDRTNAVSSVTPCSEDECGQLGISMESEPISSTAIEPRSDRLLQLLQDRDYDVDQVWFRRATEEYAEKYAPEEVFIKAIAFGTGELDTAQLEPDQEQTSDTEDQSSGEDRVFHSAIECIKECPRTREDMQKFDDYNVVRDDLGVLEVVMTNTYDICYLTDPDVFMDKHGVDEVGSHEPQSVISVALNYNWSLLTNASAGTISGWINDIDDIFSDHILSEAVLNARVPHLSDEKVEFRHSGFWPLIKRRKVQPILGTLRKNNERPLSLEEISERVNEDENVVKKLLRIEYLSTGAVKQASGGWSYVPEEDRDPVHAHWRND